MTSGDSEPVRFLGTLPRVVEQLGKAVTPYIEQLGEAATTFVEAVTPYLEPISTTMATMAERQRISNLMVEAGWLYHQTTPIDFFADPEVGAKEVCDKLNEYYKENWITVRVAIESQFNDYDVDDEAKATVREAIDAHGHGLYRSVCRLLFPEIERVLRTEICGRTVVRTTYKTFIESLVSDKSLHDLLPGGWYDFDYVSHIMMSLKEHSDSGLADKIFGLFRDVKESDVPPTRQGSGAEPSRRYARLCVLFVSTKQSQRNIPR